MKKVSVIIPIYKGNCYISNLIHMLEENWESANKAEDVNIEMILINDFPSEKLAIEEQSIKNISLVEVVNRQNCGIHFSRVQGFLQSSGDYVLFLDQDDKISPVYLKEQLKELGNDDMVICNGKNYNNLIYKNAAELSRAVNESEYKNGYNRIISPGQVLLRRKAIPSEWLNNVLKQNGADDFFLWMLMFCKKRRIGIHDKVLYCHMISGENASSDLAGMYWSVIEVAEIMKILGYLTSEEEIKIKKRWIIKDKVPFEMYHKEQKYKKILEKWMVLKERKLSVESSLTKCNINKIAIYGGGILGKHLYYELQGGNVHVECFIDQNDKTVIMGVKTVAPGIPIEPVDAIIVTPIMEFAQIRERLREHYSCDIVSIESVISNVDCELQDDRMD